VPQAADRWLDTPGVELGMERSPPTPSASSEKKLRRPSRFPQRRRSRPQLLLRAFAARDAIGGWFSTLLADPQAPTQRPARSRQPVAEARRQAPPGRKPRRKPRRER
jgi:hypothetical protein